MIFSFLSFICVKGNVHEKISHLLSKLAPPYPAAAKARLYLSIPIKGMALLTLCNNRHEPMSENSSGTGKSSF
jgi:hypothetical protein